MALRKASEPSGLRRIEARSYRRDTAGLCAQLKAPDVSTRRWAARDLADHPEAVAALCEHLRQEPDLSVREVIFTTLESLGGPTCVAAIVPLLRSEDANLRNSAIELLSQLPHDVAPWVDRLLADADPDVRMFTVNLLGELKHPDVQRWLGQVLDQDPHINVAAAALEVLTEVGTPASLGVLARAQRRFASDPFMAFAAELAIQRIEAS